MGRLLALLVLVAALTGCGSASSGRSTSSPYLDYCSPGGIWRAPDGTVAIIDETPRMHLVQPNGVQYFGTLDGEGGAGQCWLDKENSAVHAALPVGQTLVDGSTAADGHVSGDWRKRQGVLNISGRLDSTNGSVELGFSGNYDPLHGRRSDLSLVAGSYQPTTDAAGEVVTIDSQGKIFSQSATTGCVMNGTVQAVDPHYNVYRFEATYANCTGAVSVLNGFPARGLGYIDSSKNPQQLFMSLEVSATSQHFSVVRTLRRI
jgi:hypothetical protein